MTANAPPPFRLTVLNPGGRDPEQHFANGASAPGEAHQPTNFHAYAACTRGSFHRDVRRAVAENTPVLLLLRGNFSETERALAELKRADRTVVISLKETGMHQVAQQLSDRTKLDRFLRIVKAADACLAATPESADLFRAVRGDDRVRFIPTPYPLSDRRWDFSRPHGERVGIFVGTREFFVPSRNHLAALLLAKDIDVPVTVWNTEGRKGASILDSLGFQRGKLRVLSKYHGYSEYLREIASHRLVLQLDRSSVPGQVAGDALLARVPCIGGNGAVDRLAFGGPADLRATRELAGKLLGDDAFSNRFNTEAQQRAKDDLSFEAIAPQLSELFSGLTI